MHELFAQLAAHTGPYAAPEYLICVQVTALYVCLACACVLPCELSSAEPSRRALELLAQLAARTDRCTVSKCCKHVLPHALYVGVACECQLSCGLATAASSRSCLQSWQSAPTAAERRSASIVLLLESHVYVWPLAVRYYPGSADLSRAVFAGLRRRLLPALIAATRQNIPFKPFLTRCLIWVRCLIAVRSGHH